MNTKNESPHMIDVLFILTLFLVFALSSISVVGIGIQVYRTIVTDMDSNYNSRTAIAYVTEKLREADASGAVRLGTIDDCDALILSQTIGNKEYCTYLYAYDGNLCELFTSAEAELPASAGQSIMEIRSFKIYQEQEQLYRIEIRTSQSQSMKLYLSTHSQSAAN